MGKQPITICFAARKGGVGKSFLAVNVGAFLRAEGKRVLIIGCDDQDSWLNAGYYTDSGKEANYTIYDLSGWGPDYGDPSTYLDTFLPDYAGYMIKCIGIY